MPAPEAAHDHAERRPTRRVSGLEKVMRGMSAFTMLMTVPQVLAIWVGRDAHGVSFASWAAYLVSAFLWLAYGIQRRDRTIWVPCLGWIALDAAIVVGALVYG